MKDLKTIVQEPLELREKIVIHHAYNGFLYAPVFLANYLQLFPGNCKLDGRGGDAEAIQPLCDEPTNPNERHWFAICDPLSDHLQIAVPRGTVQERLCLVGGMINVAPVWLYNPCPKISELETEDGIRKYKGQIRKIVTYPAGTTGYLFGERIRRNFLDHITHVTPVPFGDEFNSADESTLVVTSDILRVVNEDLENAKIQDPSKRTNPIIFRYPEKGPIETRQFLFTGILTRRQTVLKENFDVLLAVVGAIKKAIHFLSQENVDELHIQFLATHFRAELVGLGFHEITAQHAYVRRVLRQMKKQSLFWETLIPSELEFNNAESEWAKIRSNGLMNRDKYIQKVPSILLSPQRFTDFPDLQNAVIDRTPKGILERNTSVKELFKDSQIQAAVIEQIPETILEKTVKVQQIVKKSIEEIKQNLPGVVGSLNRTDYWRILAVCAVPLEAAFLVWYFFEVQLIAASHNVGNSLLSFGIIVSCLAIFVLNFFSVLAMWQFQRRKFWRFFVASSVGCPMAYFAIIALFK